MNVRAWSGHVVVGDSPLLFTDNCWRCTEYIQPAARLFTPCDIHGCVCDAGSHECRPLQTSRPRTFPCGEKSVEEQASFIPATKDCRFMPPAQRGVCTGLTSRWGGACCCQSWGRDPHLTGSQLTTEDESRQGNQVTAALKQGHTFDFLPTPVTEKGEKTRWKTTSAVCLIFIGVMRFPHCCSSLSRSSSRSPRWNQRPQIRRDFWRTLNHCSLLEENTSPLRVLRELAQGSCR